LAGPREGLDYAAYVESAGCYLKFNDADIASLISSSQKDSKINAAIAESLYYQSNLSDGVILSESTQHRLMDFMLSLKEDQQVRMAGFWSRIKELSPSVQKRMQGALEQFATQPWNQSMALPEEIVQKSLKAEAYCPFTLNRLASSVQTNNWETSLNIMNSYLSVCHKSWSPNSYTTEIQPGFEAQFKSLASKLISNLVQATDEQLDNILGYSVEDFVYLIVEKNIAPKNLRELRVMYKMNEATYVGRRGSAVGQEELVALYPVEKLQSESLKLWKSGKKEDQKFVLRIWGNQDINSDECVQILAKLYKAGGDSESEAIWALAKQDETTAAKLWLEKLQKNLNNQNDSHVGYAGLFESKSAMIRLLKEGLRAKKISDEVAAKVLVMVGEYADTEGDFNATRTWIRAFAQEFKSSKKIQAAVTPAINASRQREQECDEYPRACYGGYAG
jgi:hypothetical protein